MVLNVLQEDRNDNSIQTSIRGNNHEYDNSDDLPPVPRTETSYNDLHQRDRQPSGYTYLTNIGHSGCRLGPLLENASINNDEVSRAHFEESDVYYITFDTDR